MKNFIKKVKITNFKIIRKYSSLFSPLDTFGTRHLGLEKDTKEMLKTINFSSLDDLIHKTIPKKIQLEKDLDLGDKEERGESELIKELQKIGSQNVVKKSLIGLGYYDSITPYVILRNVLEDPGFYTPYTPYQAEISQGRLENLLNFQTMITDLTGLDISNASLLDEATAAAEAMSICIGHHESNKLFISKDCNPQTIAVVQTRAKPLGIEVIVGDFQNFDEDVCGAIVQYPTSNGEINDYESFAERIHKKGGLLVVASDLLALTVLKSPGEFGADICVGSNQRFGLPLGYGGPHAGFMAVKNDLKRKFPGRLIGVSKDSSGNTAYRMSLQTREQHIRREKATSNICTAQALLANISVFYAMYHGPNGLKNIAKKVHTKTLLLSKELKKAGYNVKTKTFFDTIVIEVKNSDEILKKAEEKGYNLRRVSNTEVGISFDEKVTKEDFKNVLEVFGIKFNEEFNKFNESIIENSKFERKTSYLTHEKFNTYHTEHEILRYMNKLKTRDISLTNTMIPLGSCTMKLNSTAEMIPITWNEFSSIHPFAPLSQTKGYQKIFDDLNEYLSKITGFYKVSLQPNAGSQGEYAGLLCIQKYHESRGEGHRNICLIPQSAHGTNPASASMVGLKIVVTKCDEHGNIDLEDIKLNVEKYKDHLSALMITYPSTHGVFEEDIKEIIKLIHDNGGQVYMDGANMNAQCGLTSPGICGADVCHLNLHKTFAIPHGGGGPGMGPICVAKHLAPFLPSHPFFGENKESIGTISAAPWGSSSILLISWMYIKLMGSKGIKNASSIAILKANYMAHRLSPYYKILFTGLNGLVAHEFIIDIRPLKKSSNIEAEDIAKRLMDYGFHAPTMSFPIPNTLMIEPTESESKAELDRYCDALISIRHEIKDIEDGKSDKENNVLKRAPHTIQVVASDKWDRPYSREQAAFPLKWLRDQKVWPHVGRIDNAFGDRNLICSCPPLEEYTK